LVDGVPQARAAAASEGERDGLEIGRQRGEIGECEHREQGRNPEAVEAVEKRPEEVDRRTTQTGASCSKNADVEIRPNPKAMTRRLLSLDRE
jgi:hypothetical protein